MVRKLGGVTLSKYNSKNHSKFKIIYNIIFVVKYRQKLLSVFGDKIKEYMLQISEKYDFKILEMEVDKDHIHMMIESEPKLSPLMIVRVLKQQSTKNIWRDYTKSMRRYFWHEITFWTDGYFCSSIGEVSQQTLKKYIENQG